MNALAIERLRIALGEGDSELAVQLVRLVAARLLAADAPAGGRRDGLRVEIDADLAGEPLDRVADRVVRGLLAELGRAA